MNPAGILNDYDWWLFTIVKTVDDYDLWLFTIVRIVSGLIAGSLFLLLTCTKKTKLDVENSQNQSTKTATTTQTRTGNEKRNEIESVKTAVKKTGENPAYQTVNDLDKELSLRHADMVAAAPKVKITKIVPDDPHYETLENSLVDTGEETALPAKTGVSGNPTQTAKFLRYEETAIPATTGTTGNPTQKVTAQPRTKVTTTPGAKTAALPSVFANPTQAAPSKKPAADKRVFAKTQIKEKTNLAAPVKKVVGNDNAFNKATKYPPSQYMQ